MKNQIWKKNLWSPYAMELYINYFGGGGKG